MRVLLVSEGKHELGDLNRDEKLSALSILVAKTSSRQFEFTTKKVSDRDFATAHGKGGNLFKRAIRCLLYAAEHKFDALVFVIDQDDDRRRREPLDRAQEYLGVSIRRAFGLAVRSFDAWMIADEQALSKALGRVIQRQPHPETIDDPKTHCRTLRGGGLGLTTLYEAVSRAAAIEIIEERCPAGFAPFAARVRQL